MERRELHTLRFWHFVRILPDDFSLRRFWQTFQCATNFGFVFRDQRSKYFQDKVRL